MTFVNNKAVGGNGADSVSSGGSFYSGGGGGAGGAPTRAGQFGGGGGGSNGGVGGAGGFGGGGGGSDDYVLGASGGQYGGQGGSYGAFGRSGGGGGAGLGGALFIESGGAAGVRSVVFNSNQARGGKGGSVNLGGSMGGGGGGGGAGLGSSIFSQGSLCVTTGNSFTSNTVTGGTAGVGYTFLPEYIRLLPAENGQGVDTETGIFVQSGDHSCSVWYAPPTSLTLSPVTLYEDQDAGQLAGTFSATDPDEGDTFSYTLVSGVGSADNASFSITGDQLKTAKTLDYETQSSYSIRVRVTDAGGRYLEKTFTINLTNVNDAPTSTAISKNTIDENLPSGMLVGNLTASDADDLSHTFTFVDLGGTCAADNAAFTISGSQLRSAEAFNYEDKNSYTVCVRATDKGTPPKSVEGELAIQVNDVNEAPTSVSISSSSIAENLDAGIKIGSFSATDPDSGQTHTFRLIDPADALPAGVCSGADNSAYTIDGSDLKTAASFNYEAQNSYILCVRASDDGSPTKSLDHPFTVAISDVNEAPSLAATVSSVKEHQAAGALTATLVTTDPDAGQSFSYSLFDRPGICTSADRSAFTLAGDQLLSAREFNYETQASYTVCVHVTDDGTPALGADLVLAIPIIDINEAPAGLTLSSTTVAENRPAGTAVGSLSALDPDLGQTHTFALVDPALAQPSGVCSGAADNSAFTIDGSNLKTVALFDYESQSSYTICIRTTDDGSPALSLDRPFTIIVTDVNEAPAGISLSPSSIDENQGAGTVVGALSASDPDDGQSLSFSLISPAAAAPSGTCDGANDNAAFTIVGDNLLRSPEL